ncbi:MAG: zinc ribbon domain-containing protein [Gammaproteobacteria bacterium]|nr:zinc ribbon domain-containing protein [Gammaproteobacteria bacterium]
MLASVKEKAARIRRNLTSLDNQPVGRAALTVILFLDLFILVSLFDGLEEHTAQLTRPSQWVPQYCRDIVVEGEWNETNRLERLARIVYSSRNSYYLRDQRDNTRERHPLCQPISRLFLSIENDDGLSENLKELLTTRREAAELNRELARIKGAYDTALLEQIAESNKDKADAPSLKQEISSKTESLNKLVQKQRLLESSLGQDKRIQELFALVQGVTEADRNQLKSDLRQLNFWYPVKRLGMEMIFLLPLVLVFYFWNAKSLSRNRPFQTLVSSHLLVVAFVPVFMKIIDLVYDIIPKKLLKHIIELLESLKLVAIWHYLLMAVTIMAALALIYLFQKKLFSRDKQMEKRISKGLCQSCEKRLPLNTAACPFCGSAQFKQCSRCNKPTYVYGKFCRECGHEMA